MPSGGEWADSLYTNLYRVFTMEKEGPDHVKPALLVPWLLWRIWKNRNELIFAGKEFDAQAVLSKAIEDQQEWERRGEENISGIRTPDTTRSATIPRERVKWQKPPHEWVKCNTDGAWPKDGPKSGLGWILRDSQGSALWVGARTIPRSRTAMDAEVEALRWAVLSMLRLQYRKVIFESDAQELVKMLNSGEQWTNLNPQIQDLRHMLHRFQEVRVVFSPREGNRVADRVAKESFSFENNDPKLYSIVPSWLISIVDLDVEL